MNSKYDAVILGAGIIGTACALEFAKEGMRVAVIDREAIGAGATGAAMGHVVVMDDSAAQFALTRYSQSLWDEIAPELPVDVEFYRPGTIWLAAGEDEWVELQRKQDFYSRNGLFVELLDSDALIQAEPNLSRTLCGGLLVRSDAVLNPRPAARFLLERATQEGPSVDLFLGRTVVKADHGIAILQDGTRIHSPFLINATGTLAPALTPGIAVRKRKGHLMSTEPCSGFANHQLVELGYLKSAHSSEEDSVAFNVQPRMNGEMLIGSSRQYNMEDDAVEQKILDSMTRRARLFMPEIESLTILRSWTGFRAATPDKLPLIGPTQDPTVFLATGHEGLGITTSLATARLLADHITGKATAIPIAPYLPSRMTNIAPVTEKN